MAAHLRRSPLRLVALEERTVPAVLTVDDNLAQAPNAGYTSIQAAVNAAHAGDTVRVFAGTYAEQIVIPDTLDGLKLVAVGRGDAKIAPTNFTADASEAVIHVNGAERVTVSGFTVSGASAPTGNGNGADFGILVDHGGSATVADNRVTAVRDRTLSGSQAGVGVQFGRAGNGAGSGSIVDNRVDDYQKGGIVVTGAGSKAAVAFNDVRGAGATGVIAQNGIQVSFGADADVIGNSVSGNRYTGTDFVATGVIVVNAAAGVAVGGNVVTNNGEGIFVYGSDSAKLTANWSANNAQNGIALFNANGAKVVGNSVIRNGRDGINVDGTAGATLDGNLASLNGRYGIALEATAVGTVLRRNALFGNVLGGLFDAP